ncbi:DUF3114 domain-containing protein [Streptococcus chenjunshii]|uniref:DUF3114 domain-containing protein n=1 Tax=Streptococcus chenjunshii TaxID=2173853 RepID=UPI00216AFBC5|nr:DUF3114 domain-containing protein [Streptococcus chenjunshii]
MDGNSVNYAEKGGGSHTKMDSNPVSKYDPEVRKKVGKEWNNPYPDKSRADYFDRDKSEEKANEKLKR